MNFKEGKVNSSVGRVWQLFSRCTWLFFIDYLNNEKTSSEYYANLLHLVNNEIKKKPPHLANKIVLFHEDGPPSSHMSIVALAKIKELKF